ncbi:hypothetical protein RN001_013240 [Aquatica leii]|uniref:Ionotropic glutamate receptor C-terminal domain-containing protein n=1 Tax=Aquatica leii TaxID=1421715 RepID=A0AAN7NW71_9COLE|nr:hypothetical protein RN001_013240 [Aquatica leii]
MKIKIELAIIVAFSAVFNTSQMKLNWHLNDRKENVKVSQCLKSISKSFFDPYETVYYIYDTHIIDFERINENMYVIIDINQFRICQECRAATNFIIYVQTSKSLVTTLNSIILSPMWNKLQSPKGKYVVVTPEKSTTTLFKVLWSVYLVKSVLLVYDNQSIPKIYTCNPYAYENQCGNYVKEYSSQQCAENTSLQIKDISKNFNKNYLSILFYDPKLSYSNVFSVLTLMIQDALNVTLRASLNNIENDLTPPKLFISLPFYYGHPSYDLSDHYYFENNVWLVPVPIRISPFKALVSVFTVDIWILIIVIMMFTAIFWWLGKVLLERNEYLKKLYFVFIEMVSATINASVSVMPQTVALKILVVSYIIYIIHIQAIYTSNLIRIFTNPPYEDSIDTLEDLANSDLTIYSSRALKLFYKTNTLFEVELSNKILSKLVIVTNYTNSIEEGSRFRNCAIVIYEQELLSHKTDVLLLMKKIVDNRLTGKRHHQFFIRKGSFFLDVINRIIAIGVESGILDKAGEKIRFQVSKIINVNENMEDSDPVVLTMEHVYVVFVLWIAGMIIAIIVFIFEKCILK